MSERRYVPLRGTCGEPHACPAPVRRRVLAATALFGDLGEREIADVGERMTARSWAAGEYLYIEGDPADDLYVLASGRAKMTRTDADGAEIVLDMLGPGDLFGGVATLGMGVHGDSVMALNTTCALRIDSDGFRALLGDYPAVAMRAFDEVAGQLSSTRAAFAAVTGTVAQRVAGALVRLAAKFGDPGPGGVLLQVPLTRADLAGMTGSTTESVSRAMSAMRRDGVIDTGRRWTAITDMAALRELAEG